MVREGLEGHRLDGSDLFVTLLAMIRVFILQCFSFGEGCEAFLQRTFVLDRDVDSEELLGMGGGVLAVGGLDAGD